MNLERLQIAIRHTIQAFANLAKIKMPEIILYEEFQISDSYFIFCLNGLRKRYRTKSSRSDGFFNAWSKRKSAFQLDRR